MTAGDSHQGTLTFNEMTPSLDHDATGTAAYTSNYSKHGLTLSIQIKNAGGSLQYTLVASGVGVSGSLGAWSEVGEPVLLFQAQDVSLFDPSGRLLSETGEFVMGGQMGGGYLYGRFSIVGAGVFSLPQSFGIQKVSGVYQFGFEEQ